MSIATKQALQRRMWKVPVSKASWLWFVFCILLYGGILAWYLYAIKTQPFPGPFSDPLRLFGIIAFVMVLSTAAYSLRRRFVRSLPGKAQDWLWMHMWVGITAILIALLHENYTHILHDYCRDMSCFTQAQAGTSALLALGLLVASGIIGRLLDRWQTRIIARNASNDGLGTMQALEERMLELEYTVERLCAGKSEPFKQYCMSTLEHGHGQRISPLAAHEQGDFQRAHETLLHYARLSSSLQKQKRARFILRSWRFIHMLVASLALLIILFHGVMELLTNVLHLVR